MQPSCGGKVLLAVNAHALLRVTDANEHRDRPTRDDVSR